MIKVAPMSARRAIPTLLLILSQSLITLATSVKAEVIDPMEHIYMPPSIDNPLFSATCSLYLAESTIPNAGSGVFTAKAVSRNSQVNPLGVTSVTVLTDMRDQMEENKFGFAHAQYVWGDFTPEHLESNNNNLAIPTLGGLVNFHTMLESIFTEQIFQMYDDSILDRMKDAGAGAFSYHIGRGYKTAENIAAGHEIFASYGEEWFDSYDRIDFFKDVARRNDYFRAEDFISLFKNQQLDDSSLTVIHDVIKMYDTRTASVLPQTVSEMEWIFSTDNTADGLTIPRNLAMARLPQRPIEWLLSNGQCLDNLVAGISTLPQAGFGAFAQRSLSMGSLVVPAPAIQMMNAAILEIHENKKPSHQMLLNYCFGHYESSILICPATNANMINHCSERIDFGGACGDGIGPNAKIQWDSGNKKSNTWRNMSLTDLNEALIRGERGLAFEVTATRDIRPGEEVFVDYGIAWEEAWKSHLNSWQPPEASSEHFNYTSVTKLTRDQDIRATSELAVNPYANNVELTCLYGRDQDMASNLPWNWERLSDVEIIEHYSTSGEMHDKTLENCTWHGNHMWTYEPCKIYFHEDNSRLTVGIFVEQRSPPHILTRYPSHSVKFSSKPYSSDQFLPDAFRHSIGFPDEIFPVQWRNLKKA